LQGEELTEEIAGEEKAEAELASVPSPPMKRVENNEKLPEMNQEDVCIWVETEHV
jgi:hypothetical protein